MRISPLLQRVQVLVELDVADKAGLLDTLGRFLCSTCGVPSPDDVVREVLKREQEFPTGIGLSVAFPHCRLDTISNTCMVAARTTAGIEYGAIDDRPVRLVFMFASPRNAATEHVETLKALSSILAAEPVREALLAAPDAQTFVDVIAKAEGAE